MGTWRNRIVEEKEKAVRSAVIAVVAHQQRVNHRMWIQVDAAVHRTLEGYRGMYILSRTDGWMA